MEKIIKKMFGVYEKRNAITIKSFYVCYAALPLFLKYNLHFFEFNFFHLDVQIKI